jgi:H+/Cl- antiporter ClcA
LVDLGIEHLWVTVANIEDKHGWMLFCLWSVMFALLSCFFTRTICREAAGSGLPEMKTILGGTIKPVLLSFRLVLAKVGGLALALIAGLSVGKEGPLVQVSGALADQVMRLPLFRNVYRQDARRLEIIACACASGVAATFGTSYGSVLFSIELTSSAYLVRTLPKAFLASVCAMLVFFVLGVSDQLALFNEEIQSESFAPRWNELVAFLLIGVLSGLLGAGFVFLVEFLSKFRNRILDKKKYSLSVTAFRSYALVACIAGVTAWFRYYEWATVPQTGHGIRTLYDYLFQKNDMAPILGHLSVYFLYKFFATALSVTLPLPVGLFTPIFLTGGVMGRIIGEILTRYRGFEHYFPWEYSVLGAAGLATGVTRAMSTAVIVYELAGQPHLRLPLAIVVITAYFVGNRLSKMVYEVLIDTNGTPYVQDVPRQLYHVPVATVMLPIHSVHVLALDSTYEEAEQLLEATKMDETHFLPPLLHHFSPRSRAAHQHPQHASLPEQGLSVEQPYLVEMSPLLTASTQSRASYTLQLDTNPLSNTNSTTTSSAQQSPDENLTPHRCIKITNYAPKVIPVVKSRRNMVIVGAVLRTDVEKAVSDMRRVLEIANTPPVVLGRYEDVSFNEDFAAGSDSDDDSEPATPNSAASTKATRRVNFSEKSQTINEQQQQQQHRLHISPNRRRGAHSTNHAQSLMLQVHFSLLLFVCSFHWLGH